MRSLTSATWPPRTSTVRPPSPSTRARASTTIVLLRALVLIGITRHSEGGGPGVVAAEGPDELGPGGGELLLPPAAERGGVGRLGGAEAAVAAALVGRADRPAAGLGDGAEAGRAVGGHHADRAPPLALEADGVGRDVGAAPAEEGPQDLDELDLADRAAPQLEVHPHVLGDGSRGLE